MKLSSFAIAATIAISANAATEHDQHKYESFSHAISLFDYDWEPFTTTTDDGYILTLFRLAGPLGHYPVHRTAS